MLHIYFGHHEGIRDLIERIGRIVSEDGAKDVSPLIVKEIIYRLLPGGQGARLGHLLPSGDTQRIY